MSKRWWSLQIIVEESLLTGCWLGVWRPEAHTLSRIRIWGKISVHMRDDLLSESVRSTCLRRTLGLSLCSAAWGWSARWKFHKIPQSRASGWTTWRNGYTDVNLSCLVGQRGWAHTWLRRWLGVASRSPGKVSLMVGAHLLVPAEGSSGPTKSICHHDSVCHPETLTPTWEPSRVLFEWGVVREAQ